MNNKQLQTLSKFAQYSIYNQIKLRNASKNEWVIKGWSRCSKECGEGKQHLIVRYIYFYFTKFVTHLKKI